MSAATEFDIGPLTWVKGEIDAALDRADAALGQYLEGDPADFSRIKFGRTHLHQVHGALAIVGLDGVTQFTEVLESWLADMETGQRPADAGAIDLVRCALVAIRHYLEDLLDGEPNQPLRLWALYRTVQQALGVERPDPADLFFPDLSVRPPRRPPAGLAPAELDRRLRAERGHFQKGLLLWMRGDKAGAQAMLQAVAAIEATQDVAAARSFWWVAQGVLAPLAEGIDGKASEVRQLCSRMDLQIRRLIEGHTNVAERLLRDALYQVAICTSQAPVVRELKAAFALESLLPAMDGEGLVHATPVQELTLRRLREPVAAAEEAWGKFCAGTASALPTLREHLGALVQGAAALEHGPLQRLAQSLVDSADWLIEQPTRHGDALAMEVATGILLAANAVENFAHLGSDFAHQVDVMAARLAACVAGTPAETGAEVPGLDEMSRQAQERLLNSQVAKEIQTNLGQIEQVLDSFFRDANRRGDLASLATPLKQVAGALAILGQDAAVATLRECHALIGKFSAPEYQPQEGDFEAVASQLSALGFFVDALPRELAKGSADFVAFTRGLDPRASREPAVAEVEPAQEAPAPTVEQSLEQQKQETQVLMEALREQPADQHLRQELKQNLESLQKDADLVADKALGQQAKAALSALAAAPLEQAGAPELDAALAEIKPQAATAPAPSAETLMLTVASAEAVDAELLSIFLEEAKEVLETIGSHIGLLRGQPHNVDFLTTIRRSFHTLKGSGRMVGLKDLGETAWALEQVLNQWLRQEYPVGPELLALIDDALALFSVWVQHLEQHSGQVPDAAALVARADALRGAEAATGATPAPQSALEALLGTTAAEPPPPLLELPPLLPEPQPEAQPELPSEALAAEFSLPPEPPAPAPVEATEPVTAEVQADFASVEEISLEELPPQEVPAPAPEPLAAPAEALGEPAMDLPEAPVPPSAPPPPAVPRLNLTVSPTLYQIFLEEAKGHLEVLQRQFGLLETDPGMPTAESFTRAAHTLGSIAGTIGLSPINQLGRALEHTLLRRDQAGNPASLEALEIIRLAIAALEEMVASVGEQRPPEPTSHLANALDSLYPAAVSDFGGEEVPAVISAPLAAPAPSPVPLCDELDPQLLPIFLDEAQELTQSITEVLRLWHDAPQDADVARSLARLLHTLKGSARMAGAMNLGELTHALETRVEEAHKSGAAESLLIEDIQNAFDAIVQVVERLGQGPEESPLPQELMALPDSMEGNEGADLQGMALESGVPAESSVAMAVEAQPKPVPGEVNVAATDAEPEGAGAAARNLLRVRADLMDRLVNEAGELSISRARIEGEMLSLKESLLDLTENVIRLRRQLREVEIQAESQIQARTAEAEVHHAGFDPLEFDRFTRFQELTRMMAESVNDVATVQQNLLKNLDGANAALVAQSRLNKELQQSLMSVRMVPFQSQVERLHRIVRQTAKEVGKRANLDISGSQVELDRGVLDKMVAPLEHMLRNAVVHGLESREARLAAGKDEIGEISLKLAQEGNEIIITLADDGAGLDLAGIRAKAEAQGRLSPGEVVEPGRLADLIFAPGFSTAGELSQVAGRGVGMDVVRTEVANLGGRMEIQSLAGQGLTLRIYLPLTLAVTQALLVRVGNRRYAIPSAMIEQVQEVKEKVLADIRSAGQVEWLGNRYPFHFLPHLLGEPSALPEAHRLSWLLLLRSGVQRTAIQVDELFGNREIVVKNVGPQLARVVGIAGATVLGDGQVVLILNPVALAAGQVEAVTAAAPAARPAEVPAATLPTVMVVDDSLTVRKITSRLLAREGYHVLTAKDGVDALEQLMDTRPDVLLVDIEMPRMDGFDLTRNVRADDRLKGVPIIMITSRTADKHRNYAFEIGVNHYLGKPYQEEELLALVQDYVRQQHGR